MQTAEQVRDALVACLRSISVASGYRNDVDPTHVHKVMVSSILDNYDDSLYPKLFVIPDAGMMEMQIGMNVEKQLSFTIMVVVKAPLMEGAPVPMDYAMSWLEDIERMITLNANLSNNVELLQNIAHSFDGGALEEEAVVLIHLETRRR